MEKFKNYLLCVIAILLFILVIVVINATNSVRDTKEQIRKLTSAQNQLASANWKAVELKERESENDFLAKYPTARIFRLNRKSEITYSLYTDKGNYDLDFIGDYAKSDRNFFDEIELGDRFSCFLTAGESADKYDHAKVNGCTIL